MIRNTQIKDISLSSTQIKKRKQTDDRPTLIFQEILELQKTGSRKKLKIKPSTPHTALTSKPPQLIIATYKPQANQSEEKDDLLDLSEDVWEGINFYKTFSIEEISVKEFNNPPPLSQPQDEENKHAKQKSESDEFFDFSEDAYEEDEPCRTPPSERQSKKQTPPILNRLKIKISEQSKDNNLSDGSVRVELGNHRINQEEKNENDNGDDTSQLIELFESFVNINGRDRK